MEHNDNVQPALGINLAPIIELNGHIREMNAEKEARETRKPKLQSSTKYAFFGFGFFTLLTITCITLYTITGDWPREIVEVLALPIVCLFGVCVGGCCYKEKKGGGQM